MQIKLPQQPKTAATPTRMRIEYNVNSPRKAQKTKGIKISDIDDYEDQDNKQPVPDFITQVAPSPSTEDELPDTMEQSSCFCSTSCFFGVGKSNKNRNRGEANIPSSYPMTNTATFETDERVEVRTEKRASIIRTNTAERKTHVQQTAVQLATIPVTLIDECCSPDIEESCEEGDQKKRKAHQTETNSTKNSSGDPYPWKEEGEVVLVSEDETSSSEPFTGLLGPKLQKHKGKKCLVLDLDETLVHSSFKPIRDADYIVPVEIDRIIYKVYVRKRPFVDEFLLECAKDYEVVVFTASLSKYANPLLDMLDPNKTVTHRLFRESCVFHRQAYVKDLTKLGRKMEDIIIVDNSALSYAFQPKNAIPITSWFNDRKDVELRELLPVLQTTLKDIDDVRKVLDANKTFEWICAQAGKTHITAI